MSMPFISKVNKMKRILLILLSLIVLISCEESRRDEIARLVKEWDGKEVRFPERPIFTIQGNDTVDFSFRDTEYKVVSYMDSIGCISCKLQLERWMSFIHEVDSLTNEDVPFVFCFHTSDIKEIRHITWKYNFKYPVFLDEKGTFNTLNHLPDDMDFQTFLLDKDNRIIAIGNPILNPKVKELYLEKLASVEEGKSESLQTELMIDKMGIDFGTFLKSENKEGKFQLTNLGNDLLVIHDVIASCGCTKVEYSKQPVRPDETMDLTIRYEADEVGSFNKVLTIYSNAVGSPHKVWVKGKVK